MENQPEKGVNVQTAAVPTGAPKILLMGVCAEFANAVVQASGQAGAPAPENLGEITTRLQAYLSGIPQSITEGGLQFLTTTPFELTSLLNDFCEMIVAERAFRDWYIGPYAVASKVAVKVFQVSAIEDCLMNPATYMDSCLKTESGEFYQPERMADIQYILDNLCFYGTELDVYKKAMFYGKPIPPMGTPMKKEPSSMPDQIDCDPRLVHAIVGLTTEAIELVEPLRDHILEGKPLDMKNLYEEAGDALFYLSLLFAYLNVSYEQAMHDNHQKRMKRYPGGQFSQDAALNRDVEAELQEMTKSGNFEAE